MKLKPKTFFKKIASFALISLTFTFCGNSSIKVFVKEVVDGDSVIVIAEGQSFLINLYCVDALELDQKWGERAREFVEQEILDSEVEVTLIDENIPYILISKQSGTRRDIGVELLTFGFAAVDKNNCSEPYLSEYLRVQEYWQSLGVGMWEYSNPTMPWEWREQQR